MELLDDGVDGGENLRGGVEMGGWGQRGQETGMQSTALVSNNCQSHQYWESGCRICLHFLLEGPEVQVDLNSPSRVLITHDKSTQNHRNQKRKALPNNITLYTLNCVFNYKAPAFYKKGCYLKQQENCVRTRTQKYLSVDAKSCLQRCTC